jgi:hypothetical protein
VASIYKYILGALVLAVVVISAILMASVAGLLGGALVILVALIGVLLAVRFQVNRDERAAQADWSDVLDDQPADGSGFTGWVPTPPRGNRITPAPASDLPPPPDPLPAPPVLEASTTAPPSPPAETASVEPEWAFPLEDAPAETTAFAGHDDFPDAVDFPSPDFRDLDPGDDHAGRNGRSGPDGNTPVLPAHDPVPAPPEREHADALAYVGAAAAAGGQRRSIIDWSGPVRTVEAQVRTNEDILEASAATALPTGGDRPAPAAGSELARLLAKVEARLREYE